MARYDDAVGMTVKAKIALVMWGIAKENTKGGTRRKLVRSGGGEVRITLTIKDAKMLIRGRRPQ